VVEDVTDIVLNLKKVSIVSQKREPVTLQIKANRDGSHHRRRHPAGREHHDHQSGQVIGTLDKPCLFSAEIEIKTGRGYYPGEQNKKEDQAIGVIPIDLLSVVRLWRTPAWVSSRTMTS
jgi:DNA-directed RNA polymerase subunit alpha